MSSTAFENALEIFNLVRSAERLAAERRRALENAVCRIPSEEMAEYIARTELIEQQP